MNQKYLEIIKRQEETSEIVARKYDLFRDSQDKLGELYKTDPLISGILKKTEKMTKEEVIQFLLLPENSIKNSPRYKESIILNEEMTRAELDYYDSLFSYIQMIDKDRKMMFSTEYIKRIEELADSGYLLYYLQTPDYSLELLNSEKWEKNFVDYFEKGIDILFSEIIRTGLASTNELQFKKAKALNNAITFFKNQQYDACAKELFPLLENDYNNADNVRDIRRKGYEKAENIKEKVSKLGYEYYINVFDKISNFYRVLTINTDKWDKKEVNRNALMHGNYDRETTKKDCVKLFTMFISFKEITYYIQRIDDLLEHFKMIKAILPEFKKSKNLKR